MKLKTEEFFEKIVELVVDMADAIALIIQDPDYDRIDKDLGMLLQQAIRIRTVISDRSQFLKDWDAAPALLAARSCVSILDFIATIRPDLDIETPYGNTTLSEENRTAAKLVQRLEISAGPAGPVVSVMLA